MLQLDNMVQGLLDGTDEFTETQAKEKAFELLGYLSSQGMSEEQAYSVIHVLHTFGDALYHMNEENTRRQGRSYSFVLEEQSDAG
jgi:hypothetical protein